MPSSPSSPGRTERPGTAGVETPVGRERCAAGGRTVLDLARAGAAPTSVVIGPGGVGATDRPPSVPVGAADASIVDGFSLTLGTVVDRPGF
ncbi:hypothetical protein [Halalkalicoccus sp. NIPERK01]|uniref:hypothetical protein n=1 Tax=Halalkalicoccus sp. NIPERK01 TaxID=3053469 RepID=UPI00256ECD6B|nr:hypothetical protein [Halalkalicoccus sp. NIPERK01]MDL5360780.1 hypothetical protein [Halalkalicoccus sp. NIPERK01]